MATIGIPTSSAGIFASRSMTAATWFIAAIAIFESRTIGAVARRAV